MHGEEGGSDVDTGGVTKLKLEGGMSRIGSESLQGFFRQANDHGALCQRLGSISLASRTLQRDCAIDGDGERHKGEIVKARKR
jgi:hypothetical protein